MTIRTGRIAGGCASRLITPSAGWSIHGGWHGVGIGQGDGRVTDTAWNLLAAKGVRPADIEALFLVVEGQIDEIRRDEAQARPEAIQIFSDFDDPDWHVQPLPE